MSPSRVKASTGNGVKNVFRVTTWMTEISREDNSWKSKSEITEKKQTKSENHTWNLRSISFFDLDSLVRHSSLNASTKRPILCVVENTESRTRTGSKMQLQDNNDALFRNFRSSFLLSFDVSWESFVMHGILDDNSLEIRILRRTKNRTYRDDHPWQTSLIEDTWRIWMKCTWESVSRNLISSDSQADACDKQRQNLESSHQRCISNTQKWHHTFTRQKDNWQTKLMLMCDRTALTSSAWKQTVLCPNKRNCIKSLETQEEHERHLKETRPETSVTETTHEKCVMTCQYPFDNCCLLLYCVLSFFSFSFNFINKTSVHPHFS